MFFEKNAFTVTIQLGDKAAPSVERQLADMLPKTRQLWDSRYPWGKHGGWIHYRVLDKNDLENIIRLIMIKKIPKTEK